MEDLIQQLKTNQLLRYGSMAGLVLIGYVFSSSPIFTTILTVLGLVLGRLTYNDAVDHLEG